MPHCFISQVDTPEIHSVNSGLNQMIVSRLYSSEFIFQYDRCIVSDAVANYGCNGECDFVSKSPIEFMM